MTIYDFCRGLTELSGLSVEPYMTPLTDGTDGSFCDLLKQKLFTNVP